VLGPEIVQQTTEKIKMIQEKMQHLRVVRKATPIREEKMWNFKKEVMCF
ncbi:hypothetical protein A2U01_0097419, partial [Trifolium medium]|nr:hypothetical protein [Trifolium medium]